MATRAVSLHALEILISQNRPRHRIVCDVAWNKHHGVRRPWSWRQSAKRHNCLMTAKRQKTENTKKIERLVIVIDQENIPGTKTYPNPTPRLLNFPTPFPETAPDLPDPISRDGNHEETQITATQLPRAVQPNARQAFSPSIRNVIPPNLATELLRLQGILRPQKF